ncbi:MAG: transglutaminase domain-containing protein [Candidatus Bathyarchaeia archaeon]
MQRIPELEYPGIVKVYRQRFDRMATPEYKQELRIHAEAVLHDPVRGLDWKQLLNWEHRHLEYTKEELPKPRAEMPIDIIVQAKGRCGEFALLYNGLLLANGYQTRVVIDCSVLQDKSRKVAGDHVWNEILSERIWMHVDPTEKRINCPSMYAMEWSKDVNLVYAIAEKQILDVTENYRIHINEANCSGLL